MAKYTSSAVQAAGNQVVAIAAIGIIFAIILIVIICVESKENEDRAREGLPRKRHHDVTDYDYINVYDPTRPPGDKD